MIGNISRQDKTFRIMYRPLGSKQDTDCSWTTVATSGLKAINHFRQHFRGQIQITKVFVERDKRLEKISCS